MMTGLLWIVGVYGAFVAMLHVVYRLQRGRETERSVHVVLVTKDNGLYIEWYLRSLVFFSRVRGRSVSITVIDEGSADETVPIIEQFARGRDDVRLERKFCSWQQFLEAHPHDAVYLLQLSGMGPGVDIPAFL